MKKVIIIGSGGAGKSTLARKLGDVHKKAPAIIESLKQYKEQGKIIFHFTAPAETEAFISALAKKGK
ncbi:hypothetical protein AABM38_06520 [Heyndrickxia sp. MSNUG]|uniref:hypothetical protein n=1 Tax=Heyndrickxia sp. MSNUG TaxID=3136677 RepID=UPI003C2E0D46